MYKIPSIFTCNTLALQFRFAAHVARHSAKLLGVSEMDRTCRKRSNSGEHGRTVVFTNLIDRPSTPKWSCNSENVRKLHSVKQNMLHAATFSSNGNGELRNYHAPPELKVLKNKLFSKIVFLNIFGA